MKLPNYALLLSLCLLWQHAFGEDTENGFVPIFDGKTFSGWEGDIQNSFRIQEGAIVGGNLRNRIPQNEFLATLKRYTDFELRLQVKLLGEGANAGIQFRTERIPDHHEVIGYQADMGQQYWGALYDESRRRKILAGPSSKLVTRILKPNDWNDYVIRAKGNTITLYLNGTKTVDYIEPDATIPQTGRICLQIHSGPPSEAWYRHIRIKDLSEKAPIKADSAPR